MMNEAVCCQERQHDILPQGGDFQLCVEVGYPLVEGENLITGFYSKFDDKLICSMETDKGDGVFDVVNNCYVFDVTHDKSVNMTGDVYVEATVTSNGRVIHSEFLDYIFFEKRQNNKLI